MVSFQHIYQSPAPLYLWSTCGLLEVTTAQAKQKRVPGCWCDYNNRYLFYFIIIFFFLHCGEREHYNWSFLVLCNWVLSVHAQSVYFWVCSSKVYIFWCEYVRMCTCHAATAEWAFTLSKSDALPTVKAVSMMHCWVSANLPHRIRIKQPSQQTSHYDSWSEAAPGCSHSINHPLLN